MSTQNILYALRFQKQLGSGLLLLVFSPVCLAEVYQTISPEGMVVYTDNINTAYGYNANTDKINILDKLTTQNTYLNSNLSAPSPMAMPLSTDMVTTNTQAALPNVSATETTLSAKQAQTSKKGDYVIQIISPQNEMVYRRPTQTIPVSLKLNRALKTGDQIIYRLNDKTLATTKNLQYSIATTNLDPQKYTLTVLVENVVGEAIASDTVTLYVISNNLIFQQKRKAFETSQKAKANSPWYKKLKAS